MPSSEEDRSRKQSQGSVEPEEHSLSSTLPRPSYSPVTPVIQPAVLAPTSTEHQWIDEPPAEPVSLEENPDAIAVRAAISILQLQRQQSLQDIRDLNKMKTAALKDPEAFLADLRAGKVSNRDKKDPTTHDNTEPLPSVNGMPSGQSSFGTIPEPQNVVRAPAINWSKYHIVGEPLDKLHEAQRRRPDLGEAESEEYNDNRPDYVIAAPYRPFIDKLEPSTERRPSRNQ